MTGRGSSISFARSAWFSVNQTSGSAGGYFHWFLATSE
jgi:hypothetical protein